MSARGRRGPLASLVAGLARALDIGGQFDPPAIDAGPRARLRVVPARREPRFQIFWRTGWCQFPVYAPNAGDHWPRYQARIWQAPFIFVLWLVRGLRARCRPARGRPVTLEDMLAFHPPGRGVCRWCRGTGIDRSGRAGRPVVRFCPKMQAAFIRLAGFRVVDTPPRWLAGFEPERLVR